MFNFLQITKLIEALVKVSKRELLYGYAYSQLGKKKSGLKAPITYGCAEAVNRIYREAFGNEIGGDVSTSRMNEALSKGVRFARVYDISQALPGDIVISPTGMGSGAVPNGHVGIKSNDDRIMSNNSITGIWEENYTFYTWTKRYVIEGGYPLLVYRPVV